MIAKQFSTTLSLSLMDNPRPETTTPARVLEWRNSGTLVLAPKFQRNRVWTLPQKSYFIDTLLQSMPCPPLYFRNKYDVRNKQIVHEVIDGQQRLGTVLDFIDGAFAISTNLEAPYAGKKYDDLSQKQQQAVLTYSFNCEMFQDITDQEVFEVFRRINTYSSPLTKQELRHGRYFGPFSQVSHRLALEYLPVWRGFKVLSERRIARMQEVQLTSALLITQMDGIQDKNDSIEDFYKDYDESFPGRARHESQFRTVMDYILEIVGEQLQETQFRKPAFFYSLFGAVYHRVFRMPGITVRSPARKLDTEDKRGLAEAVDMLSKVIMQAQAAQRVSKGASKRRTSVPKQYAEFAAACVSQTDNLAPRRIRLVTLYRKAFS